MRTKYLKSKIFSKIIIYNSLIFIIILLSFFSYQSFSYQPKSAVFVNPRRASTNHRNTLYLYYPTSADSTFPDYSGAGADTSPLDPFDVADLDGGIGTTSQLRQRISELVEIDYWEFDVDVISTTATPNPTEDRWQIVGIGSDADMTSWGSDLFGEAQVVDIGDNDAQDYARIWAGSFLAAYGGTGEALEGLDSTLERWATAIAGTVSHEVAHNYGSSHPDSAPRPSSAEDAQNNHILATGSTGLTGDQRAGLDRHFSDTSYEILGYNLGLNVKTVYNWDFYNPNDEDAYEMIIKILSEANSLTVDWAFLGSLNPWETPTITAMGTTEAFQGDTYNVYELNFSTAKVWSGGSPGIVPPAGVFHTGAGFSEPDPIIVTETTLFNITGEELPLSPRVFGFDTGEVNMNTGLFRLRFINPLHNKLILRDFRWLFAPRIIDIETMTWNTIPMGLNGLPISNFTSQFLQKDIQIEENAFITIANLTSDRSVDNEYDPGLCNQNSTDIFDTTGGEVDYCLNGTALSLFPSTYTYITATVVDTNATFWDDGQQAFVNGEKEYDIFYQFAGFIPDFNDNGVDDLLDIRQGTSEDLNQNGIPDEAEETPVVDIPGFSISFIAIAIVIPVGIIILFTNKIKKE